MKSSLVMENKKCWCGCESFYIQHSETGRKNITITCQLCKAERKVWSPGIAVDTYAISPDFKED